jgi:excisionase family DNA binding protein
LDEGRYISLGEAAARCGISHSQLRLLARTGKLQAFKVGKTWVTTLEAVDAYLNDPALRSKDPLKNKRT